MATFALYDNPPRKTQAENINNVSVVVETPKPEVKQESEIIPQQQLPELPKPSPAPQPKQEVVKPQPAKVSYPVGCEQYVQLLSKYNWNVQVAINVMRAESGCNPNAIGDRNIPPVSCGLFQVRTLQGRPSCEELQNPETNVAWAYRLYTASGWQPWSVCRTKVSCY